MNLTISKNWIDTHFHVFNAGLAVEGARYVPQYSAQLSDWMKQAQNVGVTRGVWVQPSFLGTDNSLMINALECPRQPTSNPSSSAKRERPRIGHLAKTRVFAILEC